MSDAATEALALALARATTSPPDRATVDSYRRKIAQQAIASLAREGWTLVSTRKPGTPYTIRRNRQGHAEAIERDGYTMVILDCGAERNEQEIERIVEILNG